MMVVMVVINHFIDIRFYLFFFNIAMTGDGGPGKLRYIMVGSPPLERPAGTASKSDIKEGQSAFKLWYVDPLSSVISAINILSSWNYALDFVELERRY